MHIVAPRRSWLRWLVVALALALLAALRLLPRTAPTPPTPAPPPPAATAIPPAATTPPRPASALEQRLLAFTDADFDSVYRAYLELQADPDRAIPALVSLLDRTDRVPLRNTADLIYPGATRFYGHGWAVNYDIDWIADRAGWVLEELAFQDFGYAGEWRSIAVDEPAAHARHRAAGARARAWWEAGVAVRRWDALLAALDSDSARRRGDALSYLASHCREPPIPGLDERTARRALLPRMRRIARSGRRAEREYARDVLADPPWAVCSCAAGEVRWSCKRAAPIAP